MERRIFSISRRIGFSKCPTSHIHWTRRSRGCFISKVSRAAPVMWIVGPESCASDCGGIGYIQRMSIDQIAAEALRLPPNERALLAESLWESLTDPFKIPAEGDDAEAIALALERDRQLE